MAETRPPLCDFGWQAPDFSLLATDGKQYRFQDIQGEKATLIMFICNHCPFVKALSDRLTDTAHDLIAKGVGIAAISSNDADQYPADSYENMIKMSQEWQLPFPYLYDADQSVAKNYQAVCTPDFFGFNAQGGLQYRGRFDESGRQAAAAGAKRDLYEAMCQIAETGQGPQEQIASIGCSIKWRF